MATGTVDLDVVAAALAAGADDVLYKPLDVAVLVATVSKCLERADNRTPETVLPSRRTHVQPSTGSQSTISTAVPCTRSPATSASARFASASA